MTEPAPGKNLIDTAQLKGFLAQYTEQRAAQLLIEERERFDGERQQLHREIETLRLQLAEEHERFDGERQQLHREIEPLRLQLAEEHERFDGERQRLHHEIETLRLQAAEAAKPSDAGCQQELQLELETLRQLLTETDNYAKELLDEAEALRLRVKELEAQLAQERSKNQSMEQELKALRAAAARRSADPGTHKLVRPAVLAAPQPPATERRAWIRRKGNPVPVAITGVGWAEPVESWVMDRCQGGLGLRIDQRLHAGEGLKVHSARGHTETWIDVEVCYCIADGASFRVGVKFLRRLSYPDLQQFG